MNIFRKIRSFFISDYYFIYTLREIPVRDTYVGKCMLLEGMDEWNKKHEEIWNDGKKYTKKRWEEALNKLDICDCRCIGFYKSFKIAERAVKENWGDWNECNYYKYALIYHIKGEGMYNYTRDVQWYKGVHTSEGWDCHECEDKTPGINYQW